LAMAGWPLHKRLPHRFRHWFFLLLTALALLLIVGMAPAVAIFIIGTGLIGLCYLPVPIALRVSLVAVAAGILAWWRSGSDEVFWPILGSMFMFRLIVFLYDIRRLTRLPPLSQTLPYFFLLPNACFVLFPVIDFT